MVRIVYVIPTLDQSGAERQLTLLAVHLPRDEYAPHVIALDRGGYYEQELRAAGISVDVLHKRFRFDPLTWYRLRARLRQLRPDIVQSFLFAANSCVRLPGITPRSSRVIVSERCVDTWKSGWQKTLDRRLAGRMHAMTTNSNSVADFYLKEIGIPESRITMIPNGVRELDTGAAGTLRSELGLSPDHRMIGFVGRLAPQKRLRDLLWGFHLLQQAAKPRVALVVIGDGPERDSLAEFITEMGSREKVYFTGHRADAAQLMQEFSVFCLSSEFEGMSNSLMEAMACGVPCVVSDIAANRELIRNEQTGLTFPPGNCPALAKAVLRCLHNDAFSRATGRAGQEYIRRHHSVAALVNGHRELYGRLLKPPRAADSFLNQTDEK